MKAINAMICWNPNSDQIMVVEHPDTTRETNHLQSSVGACYKSWKEASDDHRKLWLAAEIITLLIRDKVCPKAAHKALSVIDEYNEMIPEDLK